MKWRCLNRIQGYCQGEPVFGWKEHPYLTSPDYLADTCRLNPETCGKYQTFKESLGEIHLPLSQWKVVRGKVVRRKKND